MDPDESDLGPRVSGIGLTVIAILLGGAVVLGEPSRVYWILRQFTAAATGGLLVLGVLVAVTGRDRPLTPFRAALVPVGVGLGLVVLFGSDHLRFGTEADWLVWHSFHAVMVVSGFGVSVGSAIARGEYGIGAAGVGSVVLVNEVVSLSSLEGPLTPLWVVTPVVWSLLLGAPAGCVGYQFTARDPNGGSATSGSADATP